MTEEKAKQLADSFLMKEIGRPLKLMGVKTSDKHPFEWTVLYETSNSAGTIFDGPTIVIVDERDQSVKFHGQ
jgi:hypothetical protein